MSVRGERRLVVYDRTFRYAVGRSGAVVIYTPEGKKHVASYPEVTGRDWRSWEDMQWHDGHPQDAVFPSDVREYIEKHF